MKKILPILALMASVNASATPDLVKFLIERKAMMAAKMQQQKKAVQASYRLVLFYSNKCPYCRKFAPVLKDYSEKYELKIEPIALTRQTLPEFPQSTYATQELIDLAYQGKPVVYPALFIANSKSHHIYPVAFGYLDPSALEKRIGDLLPKIREYERTHG